jgi:hypothetical protein
MKIACLWLVPTLLLGFGAFGGCGGTSDTAEPSNAGESAGGASGSTGGNNNHGGAMNGGTASAGESSLEACSPTECGPQLGLPNWTCEDGSIGGPTGRCIQRAGGSCGWEINDCPPAGEGGAAGQGGQGNAAGATSTGGAGSDECGGCDTSASQICVFQAGGPGPSHFTCATQNPCGAAGACSCIVGQGTCQPNLMGAPPGHCVCDNGLE